MNSKQKIVLMLAIGVGILISLFPPFATYLPNGAQANEGYSFFIAPPKGNYTITPSINVTLLLIQWLALSAVAAVCFLLAGQHATSNNEGDRYETREYSGVSSGRVNFLGFLARLLRGFLLVLSVLVALNLIADSISWLMMDKGQHADNGKILAYFVMKMLAFFVLIITVWGLKKIVNWIYGRNGSIPNLKIKKWREL